MPTISLAVGLAASTFIMLVNDFAFDGLVAWNLVPIVLVFLAVALARWVRKPLAGIGTPAIVFSAATLIAVALAHLEWYFDWGGAQTGSSTAGLVFLFIPFWAVGLGSVSFAVALMASTFRSEQQ